MAKVIVTVKLMPDSPEADMDTIQAAAEEKIENFAGKSEKRIEQVPIAFGLKALQIIFIMDEDLGSTDPVENDLASIEHVQDVQITDVRRAMG